MPAVRPNRIEMIPISRITVLNPRARNKRQHREIVNNIEAIGLKRPITVSRRDGAGGPRYDLVCGEGRLEAFQMLGQTEIPAVVIEASHGCMTTRGVNQHSVSMVTQCWLGDFRDDPMLRRELLDTLPLARRER